MRDARRADFPHGLTLPTRWSDNDIYGHVNNVTYYSYFDTAVNSFLIAQGVLDIHAGETVAFVVDSGCAYYQPLAFPDVVHVGLRVARLGGSSVRYELGVFRNDDATCAAYGHFVHVYVQRSSGSSTPIPEATRAVLQGLVRPSPEAPN